LVPPDDAKPAESAVTVEFELSVSGGLDQADRE
jgi:hypothetical protein